MPLRQQEKNRIHRITLICPVCLIIIDILTDRAGALSGTTTVKQQKFVAKSAISAVEGGDAFVGVKQNTRPIIVIDNYDSFTYNLCQVKAIFCCITDGETSPCIMVTSK